MSRHTVITLPETRSFNWKPLALAAIIISALALITVVVVATFSSSNRSAVAAQSQKRDYSVSSHAMTQERADLLGIVFRVTKVKPHTDLSKDKFLRVHLQVVRSVEGKSSNTRSFNYPTTHADYNRLESLTGKLVMYKDVQQDLDPSLRGDHVLKFSQLEVVPE